MRYDLYQSVSSISHSRMDGSPWLRPYVELYRRARTVINAPLDTMALLIPRRQLPLLFTRSPVCHLDRSIRLLRQIAFPFVITIIATTSGSRVPVGVDISGPSRLRHD